MISDIQLETQRYYKQHLFNLSLLTFLFTDAIAFLFAAVIMSYFNIMLILLSQQICIPSFSLRLINNLSFFPVI